MVQPKNPLFVAKEYKVLYLATFNKKAKNKLKDLNHFS